MNFDGVKVFSASMKRERETLSESVNAWLSEHKDKIDIAGTAVKQSSDNEYHCITIVIFYQHKKAA